VIENLIKSKLNKINMVVSIGKPSMNERVGFFCGDFLIYIFLPKVQNSIEY
jgi:hypothetical protein